MVSSLRSPARSAPFSLIARLLACLLEQLVVALQLSVELSLSKLHPNLNFTLASRN